MEALGRVGWAARTVLYFVTAILVTRLASSGRDRGAAGGGEEASHTGALREIAEQPFGKALLAMVAVGLLAFAGWRWITVWRDPDDEGAATRVGYVASGLVYAALGAAAARMVLGGGDGGGGGGGDEQARSLTARILEWPAGPWIVGAAGAAVVAVGVYFLWRGLTHDFMKDLEVGRLSQRAQRAVAIIGEAGQCARAAVFGVVGWFVIRAAATFDPAEARGLDGALRELTAEGWGRLLLWAVALGLVAYAAFCAVRARYDRST